MKNMAFASVMLAIVLSGCSYMDSHRSDGSHAARATHSDPANYHRSDFGEPNNEPFQGTYLGR